MSARDVLAECQTVGVSVEVTADGNLYVSPVESVTGELKKSIVANKPQILAHLRGRTSGRPTTPERHAELMAAAKRDPNLVRNQHSGYSRLPDAVPLSSPQPSAAVMAILTIACRNLEVTPGQLNVLLDDIDRTDIEEGVDFAAALRDLARGIHNRRLVVLPPMIRELKK